MGFHKSKPFSADKGPANWVVCQAKGKFFACSTMSSEVYDPEGISTGNPRCRFFDYLFTQERARKVVDNTNKRLPLKQISRHKNQKEPEESGIEVDFE